MTQHNRGQIERADILARFQEIWGYSQFRPPQGEIVEALCNRRDTLVVMPTGGGKSVCFQLPALMQQGVTLVVSPLVALMENQVAELKQRRLPAAVIHGELPRPIRAAALRSLEQQQIRLLYVSPETLLSPPVWQRLCQPNLTINGIILDEAHCLIQWGETFRPTYQRLGAVRSTLLSHKPPGTQIPVAAFTATADPATQAKIEHILRLEQPYRVILNPYRPQLRLQIQTVWSVRQRQQQLLELLQRHRKQSGLVYVRTRGESEDLAEALRQQGWRTAAYHAGLVPSQRRQIEQDWLQDRHQFVVCTSAFGMGINKPDVRFVAHYNVPNLLSEYVQEVGRAGRDGKTAIALSLVSEPTGWLDNTDRQRWQYFHNQARSQQQKATQLMKQLPQAGTIDVVTQQFPGSASALALLHSAGQLEWLDPFNYRLHPQHEAKHHTTASASAQSMQRYLRTRQCRWQFLLQHFGHADRSELLSTCRCDNCQRS
ncbi:MAG: RecQ family ATP-dependent DNA helicase [Thainema sp.]